MATVWMRAKLAKMKPKVEPRFGLKTLAEHGPGTFRLHMVNADTRPRPTPIPVNPDMVRRCDPVAPRAPRRTGMGHYSPVKSLLTLDVFNLDVQSVLIPARGRAR